MTTHLSMIVLLSMLALLIAGSLYHFHKSDAYRDFNLLDLLMENGRVSKLACAFLSTLAVTSWVVVYQTLTGRMTEGYLTVYGGLWIIPIVARLFSTNAKPAEPQ